MNEILFVDDERMPAEGYLDALAKHYSVHYEVGAQEALAFMIQSGERIRAAVVDVMMPTPDGVDDSETDGGFETGLWFLGRLKAELPRVWPIPTILLTNRPLSLVTDALRHRDILPNTIEIRKKFETPAFLFPKIVENLINRCT